MTTTWNDWQSILPALALIGGALAVIGAACFTKREGVGEYLAYAAVAAALVLAILRLYRREAALPAFGGAVIFDGLAAFLSVAIVVATGLMIVLSAEMVKQRSLPQGEYLGLVLLGSAGMVILVQALDLVTFFVALEVLSLSVYALSGFLRRDPRSNEAAVKYFVMGAFATGFLLYGMALLYGATGSVSLEGIARAMPREGGGRTFAILGFVLMTVGIAFKVGAVPFHMWVPDVYEGAPTAVTAYMSVAVKAAGFGALLRLLLTVGLPPGPALGEIVAGLAIATMIAGNLLAVWQRSVKRMLAYSSIAHTGYLLAGIAALGTPAGARDGGAGVVYYLVGYTFMTLGAFAFVAFAGRGGKDAEDLEDYAGLARRRPWMALAMTVCLISLAGIPPTAGFLGKFMIFKAAIAGGQVALVLVGVLGSAVSVYYYLRVAVYMYMHPEPAAADEASPANVALVVLASAAFTLLLGLVPANFVALSYRSLEPFVGLLR